MLMNQVWTTLDYNSKHMEATNNKDKSHTYMTNDLFVSKIFFLYARTFFNLWMI